MHITILPYYYTIIIIIKMNNFSFDNDSYNNNEMTF